MALTESQIEARLTAIRAGRDSGVRSVRHGDTSTEWRSLDEVNAIIANLEAQLARVQGVKKSRVKYISQGDRGY